MAAPQLGMAEIGVRLADVLETHIVVWFTALGAGDALPATMDAWQKLRAKGAENGNNSGHYRGSDGCGGVG